MRHSNAPLFIDVKESRGQQLLLGSAQGQPLLKNIWRQAIACMHPDIVIDVGANYGEFMFSARYPATKLVLGVEANAALQPYLERSLAGHPDKAVMEVQIAIAADKTGRQQSFFVNLSSSGRSAVVTRPRDEWIEQQSTTIALDDAVCHVNAPSPSLVFKIDVEGFEWQVMSGMTAMLAKAQQALGIIEFNKSFIELTGVDPAEFLRFLSDRFLIIALPHGSKYQVLGNATLQSLEELCHPRELELDLVLLSDRNLLPIVDRASSD